MRKFWPALAIIVGLYITAVGGLWAFQRQLIYAPDRGIHLLPSQYPMLADVREIALDGTDGIELKAWHRPAPADRPTVVIFPGKSSLLRHERYRIRRFADAQMGVLLLAYRGYSGNAGAPDEQGLYNDARAALDWLEQRGIAGASIVLYGVSLGTGVATQMAAERSAAALILEAPYTSLADVAASRFPAAPVRWLLRDRFDSLSRIGGLTEPLLVLHGEDDTVVPQALGRRLYEAARAPREGFWPSGVGHKDVFDRGGFDAARAFIERHVVQHCSLP